MDKRRNLFGLILVMVTAVTFGIWLTACNRVSARTDGENGQEQQIINTDDDINNSTASNSDNSNDDEPNIDDGREDSIDITHIVGKYVAKYVSGGHQNIDTLLLNADGSFMRYTVGDNINSRNYMGSFEISVSGGIITVACTDINTSLSFSGVVRDTYEVITVTGSFPMYFYRQAVQ